MKSLVLLFSLILTASLSAQGAQIVFGRITKFAKTADTAQIALELGATTYTNANKTITVTVVPNIHIAEQAFYDQVETLLDGEDRVLYEGVVPPGYYGPPFGPDATLMSAADLVERTKVRLNFLARKIADFEATIKRKPHSWAELLGSNKETYVKTLLFDTWGQPLKLIENQDGSLDAMSDGQPGANSAIRMSAQPIRPIGFAEWAMAWISKQTSAMGTVAGLQPQKHFAVYTRASSTNIDVAADQLGFSIWRPWQWGRLWQARNSYPVERVREIIDATKPNSNLKLAILYGAKHAADFHRLLVDELGFRVANQDWRPAIRAEIKNGKASSIEDSQRLQFIIKIGKILMSNPSTCPEIIGQPLEDEE